MKKLLAWILCVSPMLLHGQFTTPFIPSKLSSDISYGAAIDFAGTSRNLEMDISYPLGDTPPVCGRPLLVMVHGGAWIAGDKSDGNAKRIREDFAKRGYVTSSVNYRLGQFHTNQYINCNIATWNCFNMTDSSEWYRANYRGIQDVHGAIRFLINNANTYNIDPNNVFVVGESAGGFIAMGVGFIDDTTEVQNSLIGLYPNAPAPNTLYETDCIQALNLATNIASMNLSRPALGNYLGTLNYPATNNYKIRAVGNFYGGAFNNIYKSFSANPPALYLYHQPCDLIVPYNYSRLLAGYANCASGFPSFCGYIINRSFSYGSKGIKLFIDTLNANSIPTSDYLFDNTSNNYNCLQQASNPSMACHAIDNYWLRTSTMANYFNTKIDSCVTVGQTEAISINSTVKIYPNPTKSITTIALNKKHEETKVTIRNLFGHSLFNSTYYKVETIKLDLSKLNNGIYIINLQLNKGIEINKLITKF